MIWLLLFSSSNLRLLSCLWIFSVIHTLHSPNIQSILYFCTREKTLIVQVHVTLKFKAKHQKSPIRMFFIHFYVHLPANYTKVPIHVIVLKLKYAPNLGVFVLFLLNSTLELIQLILVSFFEIVHLFLMLRYNNLLLCVEVLQHLGFLMLQGHLQFHCLQNTAKNAFHRICS